MRPHRRQPTRLPCPWDSPGKNTGVGCHFLLQCMKVKSESEVAQSCPTPSDPMDFSLPVSSIHGIFQARVLEWGANRCSYFSIYKSLLYMSQWKLNSSWGRGPLLVFTIRHQVQNRNKTSIDSCPVNFYKHILQMVIAAMKLKDTYSLEAKL